MKIYFMGAIRGNQQIYKLILTYLKKQGYLVINEKEATKSVNQVINQTPSESKAYLARMMSSIKASDIVIFEATTNVFGLGYEAAISNVYNKPTIVLYQENGIDAPHIMRGAQTEKTQLIKYTLPTLIDDLRIALDFAKEQTDVKFTLLLTAEENKYLEWLSNRKQISKSSIIRKLIDINKKNNIDYSEDSK